MDTATVVVDISSDEDDVVKAKSKSLPSLDWVSAEAPGADDVVVVNELSCAAVTVKKSSSGKLENTKGSHDNDYEDDNSDCIVLEGDPDKAVVLDQGKGVESDDLRIVGEKGQIACRDYPHPRYLCVTFPFSHTPHDRHCFQCHCYVCDSLAPCANWGNGSSPMDHCHATDKQEMWKQHRRCLKISSSMAHSGVSALGMVPTISSVGMSSPMQSLLNSGQVSLVGNNPMPQMLQSLRACSPNSLRGPNLMGSITNQQVGAFIQAKKSSARVDIVNMTHSVAPASHVIQRVRQGGYSAPNARPSYSNHRRTSSTRGSITTIHQIVSKQRQGLILPRRSPVNNMSANINQQSFAVLSSANQHPIVPAVPVNTQCRPVAAISRNHCATEPPVYNNRTAPRPQQRQQVAPHLGNFQWPVSAMSGAHAARLNEIIAGLEAEIGLPSRDCTAEFDCSNDSFLPQTTPSPHDFGNQSSQVCQFSVNDNAGHAHANTRMNVSISGSSLLNNCASQDFEKCVSVMAPHPQQKQLTAASLNPPVSSFNVEYGSHDQVSYLGEESSLAISKDPSVPPAEPPNLVFDFEGIWDEL